MKLWLLRPVELLASNPWDPWYDKAFGFVVRAESATDARHIADENAGGENGGWRNQGEMQPWLNSDYSTCVELTSEGVAGLIIKDFNAA